MFVAFIITIHLVEWTICRAYQIKERKVKIAREVVELEILRRINVKCKYHLVLEGNKTNSELP